jgi:1,4-alpha-glucan branching enzyme
VCNFTPVPREGYRVGVPEHCRYVELFNSDAEIYWGSNVGNRGGFLSEPTPWQSQPCSLELTLPPLAVCVFKPVRQPPPASSEQPTEKPQVDPEDPQSPAGDEPAAKETDL